MSKSLFKLLLIFLISINFGFAQDLQTKPKTLTLQLSWFDQFQFAGYYMAKEKGFYEEVGLDVNIKPFEFGIDIPNEVSKGNFDFAVGRETLILDRANQRNIVALYALFQASPLILISTKESGINKIADFRDKKIMTTIDDAGEVSLKSMITSKKIDVKNLNFIKHTHNINDLITKKTDVMSAYTSKAPYHLEKMGIEYNVFAPKDYGFDMYSDLLYTNENLIENDIDSVLKFKHASLKGWRYAYSNLEETVNLILEKYNPDNLTKDELIFEAKELKKLSYFQADILGDINLNKLQRIYDLYNVMGLVKNQIDINDFVYVENNLYIYLQKELKKLSQYIHLPYIYFFIALFFMLVFLIVYKQIVLHQTTIKLLAKEKELIKKNEELKSLSDKDHLTNLYNRRYFETIANEYLLLAKREKKDIAILILDIDNFKKINDTYGHLIGDHVICFLADTMSSYKRTSDVLSRYGGEEFVLLLPNTTLDGAEIYSENLRKRIEEDYILVNDLKLNITVSMGLTIFKASDNIDSALDRADEGLYISKRNGKNQLNIK